MITNLPSGSQTNNTARLLLALTGLALVLRLGVLLLGHVLTPDGADYALVAFQISSGFIRAGVNAWTPPLYPILISIAALVVKDFELAGRIVSVITGSLLVVPVYFLLLRGYGRRVAFWGALLTCLHPLFIFYSTQVLTEATYTTCFVFAVLSGWRALTNKRPLDFLLAGFVFGACYLLRAEAFGFLPLMIVITVVVGILDKSESKKQFLTNAAALTAGFLVLAAPYLIHLRIENSAWMISAKFGGHLWQGNRGLVDAPITNVQYPVVPSLTLMFTQVAKALRSEWEFLNLVFPPTFVGLAALGLFTTAWTKERARFELYLLMFPLAAIIGYAITLPNVRFFIPLIPLALGWIILGGERIERWLRSTVERIGVARAEQLRKASVLPVVILILIVSVLPLFFYLLRGEKWYDYNGQKRVGAWIKEHYTNGDRPRIMATVPIAAYYAGGESVALHDEPYPLFIKRAQEEHADFIVINERDVAKMSLWQLVEENEQHPGLRLVNSFTQAPGHRMRIYVLTE